MSDPRGQTHLYQGPCGAVAQLVAHLHGMEGVRGSNPLSSTKFSQIRSGIQALADGCCPAWGAPRPAPHRTAHPSLIAEILDLLAGKRTAPQGLQALEPLSRSEIRGAALPADQLVAARGRE